MICLTADSALPVGRLGQRSPILAAGRLGRVPRGPVLDRQAHRLGQEQAEHPDRQAEQSRGIEVRLQQRATGQAQVEQAADQPEADPRNSQTKADQGGGPGPRRSASFPGTSTNRSRRSRLRTLQTRLNLKKSVMQPRNDRKSQTSGSRPRSETSVPLTVNLVNPIRTGWVRPRAGTAR